MTTKPIAINRLRAARKTAQTIRGLDKLLARYQRARLHPARIINKPNREKIRKQIENVFTARDLWQLMDKLESEYGPAAVKFGATEYQLVAEILTPNLFGDFLMQLCLGAAEGKHRLVPRSALLRRT